MSSSFCACAGSVLTPDSRLRMLSLLISLWASWVTHKKALNASPGAARLNNGGFWQITLLQASVQKDVEWKEDEALCDRLFWSVICVFLLRGLIDMPPYSYLGLLFALKSSSPSFPSDAEEREREKKSDLIQQTSLQITVSVRVWLTSFHFWCFFQGGGRLKFATRLFWGFRCDYWSHYAE